MFLVWLAILLVYGLVNGFAEIGQLEWLLLITFALQDFYDARRKKEKKDEQEAE